MTSIHEKIRDLLDNDEVLSAEQQAHLATCDDCQSYVRLLADLAAARWDVGAIGDEPLTAAEQRTLVKTIRPHVRRDVMFQKSKYGMLAGLAGVGALGLFILTLYFSLSSVETVATAPTVTSVQLGATEPSIGYPVGLVIAEKTRQAEQIAELVQSDEVLSEYTTLEALFEQAEMSALLTDRPNGWQLLAFDHNRSGRRFYPNEQTALPSIRFNPRGTYRIQAECTGEGDFELDGEFIKFTLVRSFVDGCQHQGLNLLLAEGMPGRWRYEIRGDFMFVRGFEGQVMLFVDRSADSLSEVTQEELISAAPLFMSIQKLNGSFLIDHTSDYDMQNPFDARGWEIRLTDSDSFIAWQFADEQSAADALREATTAEREMGQIVASGRYLFESVDLVGFTQRVARELAYLALPTHIGLFDRPWTWVGHHSTQLAQGYLPQDGVTAETSPSINFDSVGPMTTFAGCGTSIGTIYIPEFSQDLSEPSVAVAEFVDNPMVACERVPMERRFLEELTGEWSFTIHGGWLFITTESDTFLFYDLSYGENDAVSAAIAIEIAPLLAAIRSQTSTSFAISCTPNNAGADFSVVPICLIAFPDESAFTISIYMDERTAEAAYVDSPANSWLRKNFVAKPIAPISEEMLEILQTFFTQP